MTEPIYPTPAYNDVLRYRGGGLDALPDVPHPYYIQAGNNLVMHRRLGQLGRGLVKQLGAPKVLPEIQLEFKSDQHIIPNALCKQIWAFFRHHKLTRQSEAEVILTFNDETLEWRVLVPTQLTSAGGVTSVYDPAIISPGWKVYGTMHSHPGSAFHSGTDTADADKMDGLHLTLGYLDRDTPDIAAMVSMNKQRFDYKDPADVADFSDLSDATFPEWWNRYIGGHSDKPIGFELFAKFNKPTTIKTETSVVVHKGYQKHTNGVHHLSTPPQRQTTSISHLLMDNDDWESYLEARYGVSDYRLPDRTVVVPFQNNFQKAEERDLAKNTNLIIWEDVLPKEQLDAIYGCTALNEDDFDEALDTPETSLTPDWWRDLFMDKMQNIIETLEAFGVSMTYSMTFDFSKDHEPKANEHFTTINPEDLTL